MLNTFVLKKHKVSIIGQLGIARSRSIRLRSGLYEKEKDAWNMPQINRAHRATSRAAHSATERANVIPDHLDRAAVL